MSSNSRGSTYICLFHIRARRAVIGIFLDFRGCFSLKPILDSTTAAYVLLHIMSSAFIPLSTLDNAFYLKTYRYGFRYHYFTLLQVWIAC